MGGSAYSMERKLGLGPDGCKAGSEDLSWDLSFYEWNCERNARQACRGPPEHPKGACRCL
jgi:hypothetical protein